MNQREQCLTNYLNEQKKDWVLSSNPTSKELLPYIRLNIKKKRIRNKFLNKPIFYIKRLPKKIASEYTSKLLAESFSGIIRDTMSRESFARRVLLVKPIS
jgi:hypothetical protein